MLKTSNNFHYFLGELYTKWHYYQKVYFIFFIINFIKVCLNVIAYFLLNEKV